MEIQNLEGTPGVESKKSIAREKVVQKLISYFPFPSQ